MTTTIKDPVKAAAKLARKLTQKEIDAAADGQRQALNVLEKIESFQSAMLPIEQLSDEKVNAARVEAVRLSKRLTDIEKLHQYATFSTEPLMWRNRFGFPRLAVFNLNSPYVALSVVASQPDWRGRRTWKRATTPTYPKLILDCYTDVHAAMMLRAKEIKKSIHLKAQFEGLIPTEVKEKIAAAKPHFKEMFLVAETPSWKVETVAIPPPNRDPLIVGFDGHNLWLVAAFETTPLERYIQDEWSLEPIAL